MQQAAPNTDRFRTFVREMTQLVDAAGDDEPRIMKEGREILGRLVAADDWLPDACAQPHPEYYQQYLLHCDPFERFSAVSFVWGPGQKTPLHDHTVWGLIGMLRGGEIETPYTKNADGTYSAGAEHKLSPGDVGAVSPTIGDTHIVANALADRPSISIHVYGANIGAVARHVFVAGTGEVKDFVSGYSAPSMPNMWDRSAAVRAALPARN